jgi:nucleoside-diphosphate-sugar epimerase
MSLKLYLEDTMSEVMANPSPADPPDPFTPIRDLDDLEDRLSAPPPEVIETLRGLDGDLIVLGVAGKMGPSLARMARRAFAVAGIRRRVIGVARFSNDGAEAELSRHGVETIRCDLLDPEQLDRLPDAPNVVYLAGRKFGSTGNEALTWVVNGFLPGMVCRRFRRSRIVALSTGNVYGLTPVGQGGSREDGPLDPRGEYAMSCLARERIIEHFSRTLDVPVALIRLNYATEMRYGVLVDLAEKVVACEPIDLTMGYFNAIWQADAVAMTLQALNHVATPPTVLNVTGPEVVSVHTVSKRLGELLGRQLTFRETEGTEALLSNCGRALALFGPPRVDIDLLVHWTADWIARGGATHGKPTHFEVRDGRY